MDDISGPLFESKIEQHGDVAILHVSGEIDVATAPEFARQLTAACALSSGAVVVNFRGVTLIDSTGLGVLIEHNERLRQSGMPVLRLAIGTPQVLKVFTITGLDQVFSIFPDLASAVAGEFSTS